MTIRLSNGIELNSLRILRATFTPKNSTNPQTDEGATTTRGERHAAD